jgi:hypothetical protein
MSKPYPVVTLLAQGETDFTIEVPMIDDMLAIPTPDGYVYVRREDAIKAFGFAAPKPPAPGVGEEGAQNWQGMDGAIAFHLIDRHAEGWNQVGEMMEAWRAANTPAPSAGVSVSEGESVKDGFFAHDGDNNELFDTLAEAKAAAQSALDYYKDDAPEGWNDNCLNICYGIVVAKVEITESRDATPEDPCWPDCAGFEERDLVEIQRAAQVRANDSGVGK